MWRNQEVQRFTEWLRVWNQNKDSSEQDAVGFYGLDLYSLGTSMKAVIEYLEVVDKEMADVARERYGGMMVWAEDPHEYGLEALASGFRGCEKDVVRMLKALLDKRLEYAASSADGEEFHSAEQNARLVKGESRVGVLNCRLMQGLTQHRRGTILQGHVLRPRRVLEPAG